MVQQRLQKSSTVADDTYALALGPNLLAYRYTGCVVNGMRFRTEVRERNHSTQCSGIVVKGEHLQKEIDFYGTLVDVIELRYNFNRRTYLFKCSWCDVSNKKDRIRVDKHFTSINMCKLWYKDDPFIFAYQAQQVYYVRDTKHGGNWFVVQRVHPRNMFDVLEKDDACDAPENNIENEDDFEDRGIKVSDEDISILPRENVNLEEVAAAAVGTNIDNNVVLQDDESDDEDDTLIDYEDNHEENDNDDYDSDMEFP